METISQEGSRRTPEILFDPAGKIRLAGRSTVEDPKDFFEPLVNWVTEYVNAPPPETVVDIKLEYFNSGTAKYILTILQVLACVNQRNSRLLINWYYEDGDDDILERGEYYASLLDTNFNFIEYE